MVNISIKQAKKIGNGESAFVDFPYDEQLIGKIKSLPKKYWHPAQKQWEVEVESIPAVIGFAGSSPVTLLGQNQVYVPLFQSYDKITRVMPESVKLKTKLMKHQEDAVAYGINNNALLLGDEAGLGKTLSMIATALAKKELDGYQHTLIVTGVNCLKWNWYSEICKHSDETPYILGMRKNTKGKVYIGSTQDKLDDLRNLPENYFLITNIESLRNEEIIGMLEHLCKTGKINFVILDESHKCANPQAAQTGGLLKLQAESRAALSGTPYLNKPLDLWVPLHWLGVERHSYYQFKKFYAVMGGYGGYEVVDYKHLDVLQSDLDKIMLRRLKNDVLDLPEKTFTVEYVEMERDQEKLYSEIYNEITSNIDKVMLSPNPLTEMLRLRQCTSNPAILTSKAISCAKLDRLDDLLEERISSGNKVLVVSNWTSVTDTLLQRYAKYNPATITGKIKDENRQVEQDKLNNDPSCKILIGTIGSMGTGLTLTGANTVIFVDQPWNWASFEQMSDRVYRIGTKSNVEIISLLTKDTIDERIHELITEKKELSDYLVDGAPTKNKKNLIEFLLDMGNKNSVEKTA